MTTRVGLGGSNSLSIETTENRIINLFPEGVEAEFQFEDGQSMIVLRSDRGEGRACKFHSGYRLKDEAASRVTITSYHIEGVKFEPFRTVVIQEIDYDTATVTLHLPNELQDPKGPATCPGRGTGKKKPRRPIAYTGRGPDEALASEGITDIQFLRGLIEQVNRISSEMGVALHLDQEGKLYGRL